MSRSTRYLNDKKYTYSYFRKKTVCRLCWKTTNGTRKIKNDFMLSEFITKQIGLNIKGHILKTVCSSCANTIRNFINFKKFCLKADMKLQKILDNSPLEKKRKFEKYYRNPKILKKEAILELKLLEIAINRDDFKVSKEDILSLGTIQKRDAVDTEKKVKIEDNYHSTSIRREADLMLKTLGCKVKIEDCDNKPKTEPTSNESIKSYSSSKSYTSRKSYTSYKSCGHYKRPIARCAIKKEAPVIKCQLCTETFTNESEYKEHKSKKHPKDKKVVCEICGRVLSHRYAVSHMSIHTNHKVKCPHCDHSFTLAENLKAHIRRVHMRERRYACHICPMRCFTSNILNKHIKTHFGIKDFKCELCPKTYSTKVALQRHVKLFHEGLIGQNKCTLCTSQYNEMSDLRKHMLKKHGKKIKAYKGGFYEIDVSNLSTNKGEGSKEAGQEMLVGHEFQLK